MEAAGGEEAARAEDGGHRWHRKTYTPNRHSIGNIAYNHNRDELQNNDVCFLLMLFKHWTWMGLNVINQHNYG